MSKGLEKLYLDRIEVLLEYIKELEETIDLMKGKNNE